MSYSSQGASGALFSRLNRILSNFHLTSLPEAPGIYFLLNVGHLYIGRSRDLRRRVPASQNERSNWGAVYFLPLGSKGHSYSQDERKILLSQLEASCIAAAHTMIRGHQLPLLLGNKQHARTLPMSAWDTRHLVWPPNQRHDVSLGINVMTTIFENAGVAARYCKLPSRKMITSVRAMEFSEMAQAYTYCLENPFRPTFSTSAQEECSLVKVFNQPLAAANTTPRVKTEQAA